MQKVHNKKIVQKSMDELSENIILGYLSELTNYAEYNINQANQK